MGAKKLRTALGQLAEEGVVQLFRPLDGSPPVVGVVGQLQLDVLGSRLRVEYGVPAGFDASMWTVARWVAPAEDGAAGRAALERFAAANRRDAGEDHDGALVAFFTQRLAAEPGGGGVADAALPRGAGAAWVGGGEKVICGFMSKLMANNEQIIRGVIIR